jgi:hypothetical protein
LEGKILILVSGFGLLVHLHMRLQPKRCIPLNRACLRSFVVLCAMDVATRYQADLAPQWFVPSHRFLINWFHLLL